MVFDNSNGDLEKHIHLHELINYDPLVNGGRTRWTDYCVMQMFGTRTDEADELLQRFPGIWLMAGGGQRGTKHPRDDKGMIPRNLRDYHPHDHRLRRQRCHHHHQRPHADRGREWEMPRDRGQAHRRLHL